MAGPDNRAPQLDAAKSGGYWFSSHRPPRPHGFKDLMISVAITELAAYVENHQIRGRMQGLSAELER